ncbi:hypothetical protein HPP92_024998 [Vanilla planifolia]|uniref:Uncharacterized protein n=1 Tax=Vanilla planifolia TaxID=51239 RepID=A0A835PI91_VANPL|nr:hypothetical protein HPP92_024998 [Vanilla planifolia]
MAKRGVPYALVNAFKSFLSRESRGLLAGGVEVDDHWMQGIAAELNVSDTAFLTPASGLALASSIARFYLRWFTPVAEDPVCGSVHCALVPYWSKKLGKNNLIAYQVLFMKLRLLQGWSIGPGLTEEGVF